MPSALAATDQWPCRLRSAWTQPKTATLSFCKLVWRRYLRWSWKILSYFVSNSSKTLHINFYQNRSSIVEVILKNFGVFFYASQFNTSARCYSQSPVRCVVYHHVLLLHSVPVRWSLPRPVSPSPCPASSPGRRGPDGSSTRRYLDDRWSLGGTWGRQTLPAWSYAKPTITIGWYISNCW